jgi:hypothetical protein
VIFPVDKGLTSSIPMMIDLVFKKEDTGESTNRSAKLRQPTSITIKGESPRLYMWNQSYRGIFSD